MNIVDSVIIHEMQHENFTRNKYCMELLNNNNNDELYVETFIIVQTIIRL